MGAGPVQAARASAWDEEPTLSFEHVSFVCDLNDDGIDDLVGSSNDNFLGTGRNDTVYLGPVDPASAESLPADIRLCGDFDGDGRQDILVDVCYEAQVVDTLITVIEGRKDTVKLSARFSSPLREVIPDPYFKLPLVNRKSRRVTDIF